MVLRAAAAGWRIDEVAVGYHPRAGRSKVTGTVRGTVRAVRDMAAVLGMSAGAARDREGAGRRAREDAAVPAVHARAGGRAGRAPRSRTRSRPRAAAAARAAACSCSTARPGALAARRAGRSSRSAATGSRSGSPPRSPTPAGRRSWSAWTRRRSRRRCSRAGLAALDRRRRGVRRRRRTAATGRSGCARPTRAVFARRPDERARTRARVQRARLAALGLRTVDLPPLRDVDDIADARAVAAAAPDGRFAAALRGDRAGAEPASGRHDASPAAAAGCEPARACSTAGCWPSAAAGGAGREARVRHRRRPRAAAAAGPLARAGRRRRPRGARARRGAGARHRLRAGPAPRGARAPPATPGSASTSRPSPCGSRAPAAPRRSCAPCSPTSRTPARWRTALLLDGNIGIGGAPAALLAPRPRARRARRRGAGRDRPARRADAAHPRAARGARRR